MEEFKGQIKKILYRNLKTGYSNFLFKPISEEVIFCCGLIPGYTENTPLIISGHKEKYIKNNREFECFIVSESKLYVNDKNMINEFIKHNLLPGMGVSAAEKITTLIGNNFYDFIKDPDAVKQLTKIKGIDQATATAFLAKIQGAEMRKKIFEELFPYGGNYKNAECIYKKYYNDSLKILHENPYICSNYTSIPFGIIDSYAQKLGFHYYEEERVKKIVNMAFAIIGDTGSTYALYEELIKIIRKIEVNQGAFNNLIPEGILAEQIVNAKFGVIKEENGELHFYSKYLYQAECTIVQRISQIIETSIPIIDTNSINQKIIAEKDLDEIQKESYRMLEKTGISFLIGGPGTGKTSTIRKIIQYFKEENPNGKYALCAPTGRAAERITETSGLPALTIHMLLEFKEIMGESAEPTRNENNPLDVDVLVIDEFSMVDTVLFAQLLKAVKNETIIICVGDENQLKSVKAGKVLEDLVNSNKFPVYRLSIIHRQDGNSTIIENSKRIVEKNTELITDDSFHIIRKNSPIELMEDFENLMSSLYDKHQIGKVQALGVMKENICGVRQMNEKAQSILADYTQPKFYNGNYEFYMGDKIMTIKNNYDQGYMNGDIGVLENFDSNTIYMSIDENNIKEIESENSEDIVLSYAMTVHKSQGSEADFVILLLPCNIPDVLLDNALIYVGITRAKKAVYILTEADTLERGIKNKRTSLRKTGLKQKIMEKLA